MTDRPDNIDENSNVAPFRPRPREGVANDIGAPAVSEPMIRLPPVVKALCLVMIAVQLLRQFLPPDLDMRLMLLTAFIPGRYSGEMDFDLGAVLSPVAHMFVHGGWMHLAMNVGMLMAFGTALEKALGGRRLMMLFLSTGMIAAFCHYLLFMHSLNPMIGASGGISGLFGAVLVLMYHAGMLGGAPRKGGGAWRQMLPFIAVWIAISVFFGITGVPGTDGSIAWAVHIAGFLAGILLMPLVAKMK